MEEGIEGCKWTKIKGRQEDGWGGRGAGWVDGGSVAGGGLLLIGIDPQEGPSKTR